MKYTGEQASVADVKAQEKKRSQMQLVEKINAMRVPETLERPFNTFEQQELHALFAMGEQVDVAKKVLAKRLSAIPRGMTRLGMIQYACRSLFADLVNQMTRESAERFVCNSRLMRVEIRPTGVSALKRNDQSLVFNDDLYALVEAAYRGNCQYCSKTGAQTKKCPIKRAIDHTQLLIPYDEECGCWYKNF